MKKFAIFCLSLTMLSVFFLIGWSVYHSSTNENKKTTGYFRFFTEDSLGKVSFNWNGLHSPKQQEFQEKVKGVVTFSFKVPYPIAPKFKLVDPTDGDNGEIFVASEINRIISDSVKRIKERFMLDYDGTSSGVRRYLNPGHLKLAEPKVKLSLFGTASPEAEKYGLLESMKPGNFEPENSELSKSRLIRTADLLEKMGYKAKILRFAEKQFSSIKEAEMALKDKTILDKMRYVQVDAVINVERLKVTTITAPVLAPIWLFLISLGLISLWGLRLPKFRRPKLKWSWKDFGEIIGVIFFFIYSFIIGIILLSLFITLWKWILLFLAVAIILFALYLIWKYRKDIIECLKFFGFVLLLLGAYIIDCLIKLILWIWKIIKSFFRLIILLILGIQINLRNFWIYLQNWWGFKTTCQKVLIIVLPYAVAMTVYVIYLLWTCCPC